MGEDNKCESVMLIKDLESGEVYECPLIIGELPELKSEEKDFDYEMLECSGSGTIVWRNPIAVL